jgi:uncharacterized lipoprotein YmbA
VSAWCTRLLPVVLASMTAACASAPIRYYTLCPPTDKAQGAPQAIPAIDFRAVDVPSELNRADLVVRTGPTEIALLENERWASPVKDEIQEALRLGLQRRLARTAASSRPFTRLTLDIDVHRFEAELGRYAHLEVSWRATLSGEDAASRGKKSTRCVFRADEEIAAGYAGMVEGYQRGIAALADAIVVALTSSTGGEDAVCETSIRD